MRASKKSLPMQEYSLTFPERRANSTGTSFHGGAESKSASKRLRLPVIDSHRRSGRTLKSHRPGAIIDIFLHKSAALGLLPAILQSGPEVIVCARQEAS